MIYADLGHGLSPLVLFIDPGTLNNPISTKKISYLLESVVDITSPKYAGRYFICGALDIIKEVYRAEDFTLIAQFKGTREITIDKNYFNLFSDKLIRQISRSNDIILTSSVAGNVTPFYRMYMEELERNIQRVNDYLNR